VACSGDAHRPLPLPPAAAAAAAADTWDYKGRTNDLPQLWWMAAGAIIAVT